jgi:hypothetical protein
MRGGSRGFNRARAERAATTEPNVGGRRLERRFTYSFTYSERVVPARIQRHSQNKCARGYE